MNTANDSKIVARENKKTGQDGMRTERKKKQFVTVIFKWLLDSKMCGQNEITEQPNLLCHNQKTRRNACTFAIRAARQRKKILNGANIADIEMIV